jgi:hypothetical protein
MKNSLDSSHVGFRAAKFFSAALIGALALFVAWQPAVAVGHGSTRVGKGLTRLVISNDQIQSSLTEESRGMWRDETYAALTARFWERLYSIPFGVGQGDSSGANCAINQQGDVWFLSAPVNVPFEEACTMPAGKAIVSPLFAVIDDYPCPDLTFGPGPGQSLEAFLQEDVVQYADASDVVAMATLDNRRLHVRHVRSSLFPFTAAADNVNADPCITGSPQLGVSDGYFVFIDPLPKGQHTLFLSLHSDSLEVTVSGTIMLTVK